ncbi:hypothetical protein AX774_g1456 [Zancudomyces culisetae]|uniref:Uncharacterized protein n=1 Tax=Zancudomyces culisetae TaxID=1213189 RepID=A0A1R1PVL5_ZANCU|nr:hypothetical protein AX774_g1456 [Zancudomyces culisetae]|eukprot:OMH85008.1 hypothetical protein AX774_g1456 [Zancudomyces culisetae]
MGFEIKKEAELKETRRSKVKSGVLGYGVSTIGGIQGPRKDEEIQNALEDIEETTVLETIPGEVIRLLSVDRDQVIKEWRVEDKKQEVRTLAKYIRVQQGEQAGGEEGGYIYVGMKNEAGLEEIWRIDDRSDRMETDGYEKITIKQDQVFGNNEKERVEAIEDAGNGDVMFVGDKCGVVVMDKDFENKYKIVGRGKLADKEWSTKYIKIMEFGREDKSDGSELLKELVKKVSKQQNGKFVVVLGKDEKSRKTKMFVYFINTKDQEVDLVFSVDMKGIDIERGTVEVGTNKVMMVDRFGRYKEYLMERKQRKIKTKYGVEVEKEELSINTKESNKVKFQGYFVSKLEEKNQQSVKIIELRENVVTLLGYRVKEGKTGEHVLTMWDIGNKVMLAEENITIGDLKGTKVSDDEKNMAGCSYQVEVVGRSSDMFELCIVVNTENEKDQMESRIYSFSVQVPRPTLSELLKAKILNTNRYSNNNSEDTSGMAKEFVFDKTKVPSLVGDKEKVQQQQQALVICRLIDTMYSESSEKTPKAKADKKQKDNIKDRVMQYLNDDSLVVAQDNTGITAAAKQVVARLYEESIKYIINSESASGPVYDFSINAIRAIVENKLILGYLYSEYFGSGSTCADSPRLLGVLTQKLFTTDGKTNEKIADLIVLCLEQEGYTIHISEQEMVDLLISKLALKIVNGNNKIQTIFNGLDSITTALSEEDGVAFGQLPGFRLRKVLNLDIDDDSSNERGARKSKLKNKTKNKRKTKNKIKNINSLKNLFSSQIFKIFKLTAFKLTTGRPFSANLFIDPVKLTKLIHLATSSLHQNVSTGVYILLLNTLNILLYENIENLNIPKLLSDNINFRFIHSHQNNNTSKALSAFNASSIKCGIDNFDGIVLWLNCILDTFRVYSPIFSITAATTSTTTTTTATSTSAGKSIEDESGNLNVDASENEKKSKKENDNNSKHFMNAIKNLQTTITYSDYLFNKVYANEILPALIPYKLNYDYHFSYPHATNANSSVVRTDGIQTNEQSTSITALSGDLTLPTQFNLFAKPDNYTVDYLYW